MDTVLCLFKTHAFHDGEDLVEMIFLRDAHHINIFVKIIDAVAPQDGRDIARCVNGGAVTFQNETGIQSERFQIDDLGAFTFFEQIFFSQLSHDLGNHGRIKALTVRIVKVNADAFVDCIKLLEAHLAEGFPQPQFFLFTLLQAAECRPRLIF